MGKMRLLFIRLPYKSEPNTGEGGSGSDRELGVIGYTLEGTYKEILLSSVENYV